MSGPDYPYDQHAEDEGAEEWPLGDEPLPPGPSEPVPEWLSK